jgi:hypothetical protein
MQELEVYSMIGTEGLHAWSAPSIDKFRKTTFWGRCLGTDNLMSYPRCLRPKKSGQLSPYSGKFCV